MAENKTILDAITLIEEIIASRDCHGELTKEGVVMNAERVRDILTGIASQSSYILSTGDVVINADKLVKWMDDPQRSKASANFNEGAERQIACRFENLFDRLKTLNK